MEPNTFKSGSGRFSLDFVSLPVVFGAFRRVARAAISRRVPPSPRMVIGGMNSQIEDLKSIGVSDRVLRMHLTGVLTEIASLTDLETALRFALEFGGQTAYFAAPENCARSKYATILPRAALEALHANHGPQRVEIPHGPFTSRTIVRLKAIKMLEDGASASAVRHELRVGSNAVAGWKRKFVTPFLSGGRP